MSGELQGLWIYLSASPLLWLTATLLAYQAALWVHERSGRKALLNPVLLATLALGGMLHLTGVDYRRYFDGAQFVHFLLGPAVVALAVPLHAHLPSLRHDWRAVAVALAAGSATAALSATGLAHLLGAPLPVVLSLAPKSVTTPIAMGVAEQIGGIPSLTAVLVILTGIVGAMSGGWLLDRLGVRHAPARGLAMGTASHGIGTTAALQMGEAEGAYSGLAMGLNGALTAVVLPLVMAWLMPSAY